MKKPPVRLLIAKLVYAVYELGAIKRDCELVAGV